MTLMTMATSEMHGSRSTEQRVMTNMNLNSPTTNHTTATTMLRTRSMIKPAVMLTNLIDDSSML